MSTKEAPVDLSDPFLSFDDPIGSWLEYNWPAKYDDDARDALRELLQEVVEACAVATRDYCGPNSPWANDLDRRIRSVSDQFTGFAPKGGA